VAQPQPNKYSFDGEFVTKLVALLVRDPRFAESTQGLIKASYMQSDVDAFLVDIILRYFEKYRATPSSGVVMQELHKAINSGNHRPEFLREVVLRFQSLQHADISDGQYVIDNVTEFAKQTEMRQAILEASLMVHVGDFAGIENRVREALMVGSSESRNYDLMVEAENRSERRRQVLAGHIQPVGITTGIMEIDQRLKHKGFGRGELSVWMGAAKSGKCVRRDTLVLTQDGLAEIGDYIPDDLQPDQFREIDLSVLGMDGMENASHVYNNGRSQTIRVTTKRGFFVEGTPNHPMLVQGQDGVQVWKNLSDVTSDDWLVVQPGRRVFGDKVDIQYAVDAARDDFDRSRRRCNRVMCQLPNVMTVELAEFMGMLVAEGHIRNDSGSVNIGFTQKDPEITRRYEYLAKTLFGVQVQNYPRRESVDSRISLTALLVYLDALGLKRGLSADRIIPHSICKAPEPCVRAFLSAVLGLDGCVLNPTGNRVNYLFCVASEKLARQVHVMLTNYGVVASLRKKRKCATNGHRVYRDYWEVAVSGQRSMKILSEIGLYEERKQSLLVSMLNGKDKTARDCVPFSKHMLRDIKVSVKSVGPVEVVLGSDIAKELSYLLSSKTTKHPSRPFLEKLLAALDVNGVYGSGRLWLEKTLASGYVFDQVSCVESGECETVDFTVPETHSFFANGLISHNSFSMLHSAAAAILDGKNVLFVSLENSLEVTTDRFDAHITGIPVNMLEHQANDVERKLLQHRQNNRLGKLHIEEFPIGTWRPMDADRLIQRYKANGVIFDELVVDYLDIMRPNHKSKDPIEDSKSVWMDMRAIAQREHVAIVTATQTNRGGFKAVVADATHVADDINKIRIADLVISINRDENDRAANEAKLHMAAGRNQEDGITFRVSQDLARAKFVVQVLGLC
jgi:intein/homing endonuclease